MSDEDDAARCGDGAHVWFAFFEFGDTCKCGFYALFQGMDGRLRIRPTDQAPLMRARPRGARVGDGVAPLHEQRAYRMFEEAIVVPSSGRGGKTRMLFEPSWHVKHPTTLRETAIGPGGRRMRKAKKGWRAE